MATKTLLDVATENVINQFAIEYRAGKSPVDIYRDFANENNLNLKTLKNKISLKTLRKRVAEINAKEQEQKYTAA